MLLTPPLPRSEPTVSVSTETPGRLAVVFVPAPWTPEAITQARVLQPPRGSVLLRERHGSARCTHGLLLPVEQPNSALVAALPPVLPCLLQTVRPWATAAQLAEEDPAPHGVLVAPFSAPAADGSGNKTRGFIVAAVFDVNSSQIQVGEQR